MASRHGQYVGIQGETSQEKAVLANRPERIDTSGRKFPSNSQEGTRAQPQLLTKQELDVIDNQLIEGCRAMELSRQKLFDTRYAATSAMVELERERQLRRNCADAYKDMHILHGRKVSELHETIQKLEDSQKMVSNYQSAFEESNRRTAEMEDRNRDLERGRAEITEKLQIAIDRDNLAKARIGDLEKEIGDLIRGHQAAISMTVAREGLAEHRINELQQEMDSLIQEHQTAMNITVARMSFAEQKVEELKNIIGLFEHAEVASPPPEQFPGAVKRPRSGTQQQRKRPFKHRKCKDVVQTWEEDTVVVDN